MNQIFTLRTHPKHFNVKRKRHIFTQFVWKIILNKFCSNYRSFVFEDVREIKREFFVSSFYLNDSLCVYNVEMFGKWPAP